MKAFILALFSLLAVVSFVHAADNGAVLAKYLTPDVNGKYGQLNTNVKENLFAGLYKFFTKAQQEAYYTELKMFIGQPIGQVKYAEVKALPKIIDAIIKKNSPLLPNNVDKVITKTAAVVISDMQSQNALLSKTIWISFNNNAKKVFGKAYTKKVQAQFKKNIKATVNFWSKNQAETFCKGHCTNVPASVLSKLHN